MANLFKKALSIFVVMDETESAGTGTGNTPPEIPQKNQSATSPTYATKADISKFEKHFETLFENTNLPGPDYYEFWKMMETLEGPIPDEKARMQAVFASLKIQGLTKAVLIDSALQYKKAVDSDRGNFEAAVKQKFDTEVQARTAEIEKLKKDDEDKRRMIEKLQKDLAEGAQKIAKLDQEIQAEQAKISSAQNGYLQACSAMVSKIETDIQVFQQILP